MIEGKFQTVALLLVVSLGAAGCAQAGEEEKMGKKLQAGDPVPSSASGSRVREPGSPPRERRT